MPLWYIEKTTYIYSIKAGQMKLSFNKKNADHIKLAKVTISDEVRDYSNDPYVKRKTQEAIEFLKKVGLPEEFLKIRDAQYGKK